jgi:hypothetical protein
VRAAGGLLVLGTSLQESGRVEAQLRGRAGRQGDPGATQMLFDVTDPALQALGEGGRELALFCPLFLLSRALLFWGGGGEGRCALGRF